MIRRFTTALIVLAATAAPAHAGITDGAWGSTRTALTYKVVHKFHEIEGKSSAGEARAMVRDGKLQVQVRIPADSFDSGNGNRDSNVKAVIETAKYPMVTLKGVAPLCDAAASCVVQLQAVIDFHGQARSYTIPVTLTTLANGHVEAKFHLELVLTQHNVTLPSLMFIPIEDKLWVDGDVEMEHHA